VVVIGGGGAGLSVAAGLAHHGGTVAVLEREGFSLPLQRHCYKRHLHPHVFDWPEPHSTNAFADLPLLNWKAGMAREVAMSIDAAFQELVFTHTDRLVMHVNAKDIDIDAVATGTITFRQGNTLCSVPYATLIFALGFGVENSFWSGRRGSYWSDDSLDQHGVISAGKYLISGIGDGALVDLLRIVTDGFRQEDLARLTQSIAEFDALRSAVLKIESDAQGDPARSGQILYEGYRGLSGGAIAELDKRLSDRINPGVHVTLLAQGASPFSLKSRPLHRLLLSRLLFAKADIVAARTNVSLLESMLRREGQVAVFTHGDEERFDHVIVRHGANATVKAFPAVAEALKDFRPLGLPPGPMFDSGDFGQGSGSGPIAWAGGPDGEDYLDTLTSKVSSVRGISGTPIPIGDFGSVHYEIRDDLVRHRPRRGPPKRESQLQLEEEGTPERKEPRESEEQKKWREEIEQLHSDRYWHRLPGMALNPTEFEPYGVTFLSGGPGTGKTTFLKLIARRFLEGHRRNPMDSKFPIWVSGVLNPLDPDIGPVPEALADAAVRGLGLAGYSRAVSEAVGHLRRRHAAVFLDAIDAWDTDAVYAVFDWLRAKGIPSILAARRFPFGEEFGGLLSGVSGLKLYGLSPRSTRIFLDGHVKDHDVRDRILGALDGIPNAQEWRTTPFLLTLVARIVQRDGHISGGGSELGLYERFLEISSADSSVIAWLMDAARRDLRTDPPRLFFGRERVPPRDRKQILSTGILSGDRLLEFSHLSVGEYLGSLPPIDLARERESLRVEDADRNWQHQLQILAMAHAASGPDLDCALVAAQDNDPEHLLLVLVLRACAYGTPAVLEFINRRGVIVLKEVGRRLAPSSGRFGPSERVLMRAMGRAVPLLRAQAAHFEMDLPIHGEPGAEAWSFAASLGRKTDQRPRSSHWWPTVFHQAQALLDTAPHEVWEATRGGDPWERHEAMKALGDRGEQRDLLSLPGDLRLVGALPAEWPSQSAIHLGLLAHGDDNARAWAVRSQSQHFWDGEGMQNVLACIVKSDLSPHVRAAAAEHLTPGSMVDELFDQLKKLTITTRTRFSSNESELLDVLIDRLAAESAAREFIDELQESGRGWYLSARAWKTLIRDPRRLEILHRRLDSTSPHFHEIEAAQDSEACAAQIRGLVERLIDDAQNTWRLATAIRSLPKNDLDSRVNRLRCLHPTIPNDGDEAERGSRNIQCAAIASFEGDAEAVSLLSEFLEQTEDEEVADIAIGIIGRAPEVRALVRKQLNEGGHNVGMDAIEILGEDPAETPNLLAFLENKGKRRTPFPEHHRARIVKVLAPREGPQWVEKYLSDPSEDVRLEAIRALKNVESAQGLLLKRLLLERGSGRQELWQHFREDPSVKKELIARSREDLWEVRQAYFSLSSDDDTKIDRLRGFLAEAREDPKYSSVLPELLQSLARDDVALPVLRELITHRDIRVLATLLRVLRQDTGLRVRAHALLEEERSWPHKFFFGGERSFLLYFSGDAVAQEIIFKQVSEVTQRAHHVPMLLSALKGYAPAETYLKGLLDNENPNVAAAVREALVNDDQVRKRLLQELEGSESERKRAARILADVEDAQGALVGLISDSDKEIRRIACEALARTRQTIPRAADLLREEQDAEVRRAVVENLIRHPDPNTKALLRERVGRDRDAAVRERAASAFRSAKGAKALRDCKLVRRVLEAAGTGSTELAQFLRSPRELAASQEGALFDEIVIWLAAMLLSTLPEPAPHPDAVATFTDPLGGLFGELSGVGWDAEAVRIRLAVDSGELPRDRNIWPAANTVLAWKIASKLRSVGPKALVLACGDVDFDDLEFPALGPGEVSIGPTFFGFGLLRE
jgi:hypothetical protein